MEPERTQKVWNILSTLVAFAIVALVSATIVQEVRIGKLEANEDTGWLRAQITEIKLMIRDEVGQIKLMIKELDARVRAMERE